MSYVLILGATSDMAKEVAVIYAKNGYNLYLGAKDILDIKKLSNDLQVRFRVDVKCVKFDVLDFDKHQEFFDSLDNKPIGVISFVGYLADQKVAQKDFNESLKTININYVGNVSIINIFANYYEKEKDGFIVGVSSVAGDRGRKSNYIYGSAKAGFSAYLSGVRNRLSKSNVTVLTVKPGFVDTKMTKNLNLPKKLTASTKEVAQDIFNAQQKRKSILYTKWYWEWIMCIIKHIPETIFKRLNL